MRGEEEVGVVLGTMVVMEWRWKSEVIGVVFVRCENLKVLVVG